jgi:hypothetical protein
MTLEEIGALLGFVAFGGLAVLVFLTFQQARDLRRLREWAGRGPERAAAEEARRGADDKHPADAGEERDEETPAATGPGRLDGLRTGIAARWADLDRRLPVDPRIVLGGLTAILLGLVIATGAFGLLGSDEDSGGGGGGQNATRNGGGGGGGGGGNRRPSRPVEVAVLNATAPPGGTGTPGIAGRLSGDVESAGFQVGEVGNAGSFAESIVMWQGDGEEDAEELAAALAGVLGETGVAQMTAEVEALAGDADVALVIGQDDAGI